MSDVVGQMEAELELFRVPAVRHACSGPWNVGLRARRRGWVVDGWRCGWAKCLLVNERQLLTSAIHPHFVWVLGRMCMPSYDFPLYPLVQMRTGPVLGRESQEAGEKVFGSMVNSRTPPGTLMTPWDAPSVLTFFVFFCFPYT
jgi:hypothetical protein